MTHHIIIIIIIVKKLVEINFSFSFLYNYK